MRVRELTQKQVSSVPCPTCGVAVGQRCVLNTGALRIEPHPDRRFSAAAVIERKSQTTK
ncbi:MAG: zinc finger domain-containing protein [Ktedonobacteraceae bacterium]